MEYWVQSEDLIHFLSVGIYAHAVLLEKWLADVFGYPGESLTMVQIVNGV